MNIFKILIVDDDELSATLLYKLIIPLISKVIILKASNGLEALEIYQNNRDLDLILMDIRMPLMDGIDAMQQIKIQNPNIPIIAQTASVYTQQEGIDLGFDDCIVKPIKRTDLIIALKNFIAAHKS